MNQFAKGGLSVLKDLAKRQKLEQTQAKAPVPGMFSVLDQLIQNAHTSLGTSPQPGTVWNKYLQPGRIFSREGVDFPLKQEELEYSGLRGMLSPSQQELLTNPGGYTQAQLLDKLRSARTGLNETLLDSDSGVAQYPPSKHAGLSHQGATGVDDNAYIESLTGSPDLVSYDDGGGHFSDFDPISWHRATKLDVPNIGPGTLIEEIQSDRHSDAADKVLVPGPLTAAKYNQKYKKSEAAPTRMVAGERVHIHGKRYDYDTPDYKARRIHKVDLDTTTERRGYFDSGTVAQLWAKVSAGTPLSYEEQRYLNNTPRMEGGALKNGPFGEELSSVPDAPFKSPAEYSGLELRKALARSVADNDSFLATVRGKDQIARYPGSSMHDAFRTGQEFAYDQVIPGQLQKLARQYGIRYDSALAAPTTSTAHEVPPVLRGSESIAEWLDPEAEFEHPDDLRSALTWYEERLDDTPARRKAVAAATKAIDKYEPHGKKILDDEAAFDNPDLDSIQESASPLQNAVAGKLQKLEAMFNQQQTANPRIVQKDFPSLMLDEAVREKIRKAGIPLWALGAGITGLEGLEGGDQGPEQQNYAKGGLAQGFAKGSLASLKDFIKNNYSAQSMQAKRADRLFSEAPTASEMLAPKGLKLLVESPGKIALLKPHDFSKITKPMVTDWATQEELDRDWMEQMGHAAFLAQQIEKQGGQRAPPVMALGAHSKTGRLTSTAHDGRRSSVAMALLGAGNIPTIMYRHDPRGVYQGQRGTGKESGYIVHDHYDPTDSSIGQYDPAAFLDPGDLGDLQSANGGKLTIMPQNGQTPHYLTKPVGPYTFPRPLVDYDGPLFAKGGKVARLKELAKTAAAANWRDESWSSPEWNELQRKITEDNPEHLAMPEHLNNNFLNAAAGAPAQLADLAALVALGPTLGMGAYEAGHNAIRSIPGMGWSGDMSDRYDELYDREFADRKVAKPAGALEHLAEIGGNMGASLPVPSGAGSAELKGLRKFLSSIVEYTVPTIRPKPANYAHGVVGGSLIQGAMNPIVSAMEDTRPSVHQFLQPHAAL